MNKLAEQTSNGRDACHLGGMPNTLSKTEVTPRKSKFSELKQRLVPDDATRERLVNSWKMLLTELKKVNFQIQQEMQKMIPQVDYTDFITAHDGSSLLLEDIKTRGVVVIRGVITPQNALQWKDNVKSYIKLNPSVTGYPPEDPQILELYWTPSQLAARSHSSFLAVAARLNRLFKAPPDAVVSLENPLTYADRLMIRDPGAKLFVAGSHIAGGGIERWEDWEYSRVYEAILDGKWTEYEAYDLTHRLHAKYNLYNEPNGCSIFRTFQGWLSMSNTGPKEGTLRVYPSIRHSTAYTILRPFFRPITPPVFPMTEISKDTFLHPNNWELDLDSGAFPGSNLGWSQTLTEGTHPHLELDRTMISMPKVKPGDCIFWTCDSVHSVESSHDGIEDLAVMYIPAVPLTAPNAAYLVRQRNALIAGAPGPDFPRGPGEAAHKNRGTPRLIADSQGRRAMGLEAFVVTQEMEDGAKEAVRQANEILGLQS